MNNYTHFYTCTYQFKVACCGVWTGEASVDIHKVSIRKVTNQLEMYIPIIQSTGKAYTTKSSKNVFNLPSDKV